MKALVFSLTLYLLFFVNSRAVSAAVIFGHPNPQAGAEFGATMAFVGDVNGDGVPDLLVGAPKQDVGGNTDQGQVYLLSGATGALILTLDNPSPQAGAKFGVIVASAGDIDGDGENDLLIGAPEQDVGPCQIGDTSGCSVGQAFVFSSVTGDLLLTLNHPTPNNSSFFGSAVASIGDISGDLVPDLIVGSPGNGLGVFRPSQVFVFSGADGSLLLTINDPHPSEVESEVGFTFGSVVVSIGDVNGDGKPDILVGDAQQDVGGNVDQGQVHVFSGADGALIRTIDHPQPQAGAFFGASAAVVGNINGDGIGDILVGAPRHDVGLNPDQGRAYVLSGATGATLLTLDDPTPQLSANFGFAVAGMGNFNGDAVPELLIGAPGQTAGGNSGQGQAFIFSGATGGLLVTLDNPIAQRDANFGHTVASGGDLDGDGVLDPLVAAPLQTMDNAFQGQIGGFNSSEIGGGGGNQAPIANAGPDQTVNEGTFVNLNGTGSSDPDIGDTLTFSWTQTGGPAVTFNPASPTPTFTAPQVNANTVLTFELVVNDGTVDSAPDTVNITVVDVVSGVDLTGTITKLKRQKSCDEQEHHHDGDGHHWNGHHGDDDDDDDHDKHCNKDKIEFTLKITNAGAAESRGHFTVKFYISADSVFDGSDALVLTKTVREKIKPGRTATVSAGVRVTGPTQGKFLIAVIDSGNAVAESNETNNIATRQIP